jgi:hypothetical protein
VPVRYALGLTNRARSATASEENRAAVVALRRVAAGFVKPDYLAEGRLKSGGYSM